MKKLLVLLTAVAIALTFSVSALASETYDAYFDAVDPIAVGSGTDGKITVTTNLNLSVPESFTMDDVLYAYAQLNLDLPAGVTFGGISDLYNGFTNAGSGNQIWVQGPDEGIAFTGTIVGCKASFVVDTTAVADYTINVSASDTANWSGDFYMGELVYTPLVISVVAPAPAGPTEVEIAASIEKLVGEVTEKQDYAYAADITVEGNPTQLIWSVLKDDARKYSAAQPVAGVAGNVKVGFVSENDYDATTMGVLLTNEAKDTIWYSVEADLANEAE